MGPGETFAAIAFAGVLIALIIAGTDVLRQFIAYKQAKLGTVGNGTLNRALEERVQVLERIATARGQDLASEIEALRDPADAGVPLALERERA